MISVIIPLYNAENTIEKALDSVKSQTEKEDFEIIIVNDGSTDQSVKMVEDYKSRNKEMNITLLHQTNGGVSAARNAGLEKARGEYIALLDADDEWLPEKTEKQLAFLSDENLNIDLIASERNNKKILFPYSVNHQNMAKVTFNSLLFRNEIHPSTVILKKKILEKSGYFNQNQRYAEDVNFFLKTSLHHQLYILGESLVIAGGGKRTFGVSGLSANLKEMKKGFQKNVKELKNEGVISDFKYYALHLFYELKYILLVMRKNYYHLTEKK